MKLYYSPGACSLAPHIVLHESGLPFTLVKADLKAHKLEDGSDYYPVAPKGQVPLLELDNGERLSEGPVISQYVADQAPAKNLAPANGTMARYRVQEWLNFITSEIHKSFSPLFNPDSSADAKEAAKAYLAKRFGFIDQHLAGKSYLMGDTFTVPDAYLFTVANWGQWVGVDIGQWPHVKAHHARVAARPKVQEALKAEGLVK